MFDHLGKVLDGLSTGLKDLNIGAFPEGLLGCPDGPRSCCSQQYVSVSLSGSVAEPVSVKGVLTGIVKPPVPASTVGAVFPVAVVTAHIPPEPVTCETISSKLCVWK